MSYHLMDWSLSNFRGVVDNIRGAKDTIVSKPKEFAHLIKNRFGSADNINDISESGFLAQLLWMV